MKAYADTDVVSAIAKADFPPLEMEALEAVIDMHDVGKLDLRTSRVTLTEIERYRDRKRGDLEVVYRRLGKVPFVEDHELRGFHSQWDRRGGVTYPLLEDHPISSVLRRMGLDRTDAHHLMLAIRAGCAVFLTFDNGILQRSAAIEDRFPIRPMRPSALVGEVA